MPENRQSGGRPRAQTPLIDFPLPSPVFGRAEDHGPDEPIPPHHHDSAQLIHAVTGVMTVATEDGIWVVPPDRAVWVPAFVTHSIGMSGQVALRTIYLDPAIAPIGGERCCVVQVSRLLREAILRVVAMEQPYRPEGREARLVEVVLDEIRAARTAPLHLSIPTEPRALRVAEAFRKNPGDRRTRADWARLAGASERTLERLFHAELGMSFGKWQQQVRLLRALEILASGASVTEAAFEVGFAAPSAFISMFRRALGTTPGRYFADDGEDESCI